MQKVSAQVNPKPALFPKSAHHPSKKPRDFRAHLNLNLNRSARPSSACSSLRAGDDDARFRFS
jgi:hypothetical protein